MSHGSATLFVIGASGVGKTAAVQALEERSLPGVRCYYFDSIGVPTPEEMARDFGGGEEWQAAATAQWVERLASGAGGELAVLDGQTRPSFLLRALETTPLARYRILLLDCEPDVRVHRLSSRGQPELASHEMDMWAAYLRGQADALDLPVLDTSSLTVSEVAQVLAAELVRLRATVGAD